MCGPVFANKKKFIIFYLITRKEGKELISNKIQFEEKISATFTGSIHCGYSEHDRTVKNFTFHNNGWKFEEHNFSSLNLIFCESQFQMRKN